MQVDPKPKCARLLYFHERVAEIGQQIHQIAMEWLELSDEKKNYYLQLEAQEVERFRSEKRQSTRKNAV